MRNYSGYTGPYGGLGRGAWGRHYESDAYVTNTSVRRIVRPDYVTATDAITWGEFVRTCQPAEGTPEFQQWWHRAALRLGEPV